MAGGKGDPTFQWVLAAEPTAQARLRRAFRRWLREVDWPGEHYDHLVLALCRAVINVMDHVYPSGTPDRQRELRVRAEHADSDEGGRRVLVEVSDSGRWRPVPADPGIAFLGSYHIDSRRDPKPVRIPGTLYQMLCAHAEREKRSPHALAADAVDEYLRRHTFTTLPAPARERPGEARSFSPAGE